MPRPYEQKSYFRSEKMSLCQIYLKRDAAFACISELGEFGLVHFNDLHLGENVLMLRYVSEVTSCGEMERIIRYLSLQIEEAGIEVPELEEEHHPPAPPKKEMLELLSLLESMEAEVLEITRNYHALRLNYYNLLEVNEVLRKADEFFVDASTLAWSDSLTKTLLMDTNDLRSVEAKKEEGLKLSYLTGTIPIENFFVFERMLWRVCRGNFFIRHTQIDQEYLGESEKKFVFILFFQGDLMEKKIRKICQGFRTSLYQCPESSRDRLRQLESMEVQIKDLQIVLERTDYYRRRVLVIAASNLSLWRVKVKKVMAVYYIMNKLILDGARKYLIAECWISTTDIPMIQQALYRAAAKAGSSVPPIMTELNPKFKTPPTFNRSNRVIYGFQMLVNAYGVGNYRELNPAPYTIVTFPFLFAIMFGDFGHGLLVTIFAGWMVYMEKPLEKKDIQSEIWSYVFGGRYIILAMGIFTLYAGLVYNDVFSKSMKIFNTAWEVNLNVSTILSNHEVELNPATAFKHNPYVFGIDPVWDASGEAAIVALNSFKMKVAIILGVVHMFFGMTLAAVNHIFFRNYIDLFTMCIPQMVFFSLFLYLAFLIFLKWSLFSAANLSPHNANCAPSILITFIDMLLFKAEGDTREGCNRYMFENQGVFQRVLIALALMSIPIMLLAKPLYVVWRRRRKAKRSKHRKVTISEKKVIFTSKQNESDEGLTVHIVQRASDIEDYSSSSSVVSETDEEKDEWLDEFDMSEVFIHQGIHTIENVLGAVSHTASYLRLWALSLAHDQLSSVLWTMVLSKGLKSDDWKGGLILAFTFVVWAVLTVTILVVMEGLSAFLHTLRLHWVEFQSKFYGGEGVLFHPFDFKTVLEVKDEEES